MNKFYVNGPCKLTGEIKVSGAKNVGMKIILAGILSDGELILKNIPYISSVYGTARMLNHLGLNVEFNSTHTVRIKGGRINSVRIPLELGTMYRTASMIMGPLIARYGEAVVPDPGGCRLGKRPIDRHIEGLKALGVKIIKKEGYYVAKCRKLHGGKFRFNSNSHTGTETMILTAVLAEGETVIENAAQEPEVDDLIKFLNKMGAKIKRFGDRRIVIGGVKKLSGAEYEIMPDRNEVVTFAIAAILSGGDLVIEGVEQHNLREFFNKLDEVNASWESLSDTKTRFFARKKLKSTDITTGIYPGFMTDWQAPWAILMTQSEGSSKIHETIFEDRFGYVSELNKMGAIIKLYNPHVSQPEKFYNFNWSDRKKENFHAIKIYGPAKLHNAVMNVADLRAGATLVIGALIAEGQSIILGIEHIDRGYEKLDERLVKIGAKIKRIKE